MAKKNIAKKEGVSTASHEHKDESSRVITTKEKKSTKTYGKTVFIAVLSLLVVAAIVAGIAINWDKIAGKKDQVAASVNGEIITVRELDDIYSRLPESTKVSVSKENLLEQMINERLLVQGAKDSGLNITPDEITNYLDELLLQSNLTKEEFEQRLEAQNITEKMVNDEIYKQLLITKLFQQEIVEKIKVNDSEIADYYNQNKALFQTEEQVWAKHILVCYNESLSCKSNLTKAQALAKIKEIKAMINSTNFEELAKNYSQDSSAANGGDLGYFESGIMIKSFEDAAFALNTSQVSDVVETPYGYHIIKVYGRKKAGFTPLDLVKQDIELVLLAKKQQDAFKAYLDSLKEKSEVINFYKDSVVATTK